MGQIGQARFQRVKVLLLDNESSCLRHTEKVQVSIHHIVGVERASNVSTKCQTGDVLKRLERVVPEQSHPLAGLDPLVAKRIRQTDRLVPQLAVRQPLRSLDQRGTIGEELSAFAKKRNWINHLSTDQGRPPRGTSTVVVSSAPWQAFCPTAAAKKSGAAHSSMVRPSSPPRAHAKMSRPSGSTISSTIWP